MPGDRSRAVSPNQLQRPGQHPGLRTEVGVVAVEDRSAGVTEEFGHLRVGHPGRQASVANVWRYEYAVAATPVRARRRRMAVMIAFVVHGPVAGSLPPPNPVEAVSECPPLRGQVAVVAVDHGGRRVPEQFGEVGVGHAGLQGVGCEGVTVAARQGTAG